MKRFDQLIARIEKVEQKLGQLPDFTVPLEVNSTCGTITFRVGHQWSTSDMLRFCNAVETLYGIFLVQSESDRDEDCLRMLRQWDKSMEVVLAYRKATDADLEDGHLLVESVNLKPQGLISLRGWTEPIDQLHRLAGSVSPKTSIQKQAKGANACVPQTSALTTIERRRLVAIVLSCLTELKALGVAVC